MCKTHLDCAFVIFLVQLKVSQRETFCPVAFVKVHEHRLLEFSLPVVDGN